MKNVGRYEDSYRRREEITSLLATKMKSEALLLTGTKSRNVTGSEEIHKQVKTGLCSIIRVEDVENVLEEAHEKVADALILFCQGVGLVPTVQRKISRKMINSPKEVYEGDEVPKLNMTRYPLPSLLLIMSLSSIFAGRCPWSSMTCPTSGDSPSPLTTYSL